MNVDHLSGSLYKLSKAFKIIMIYMYCSGMCIGYGTVCIHVLLILLPAVTVHVCTCTCTSSVYIHCIIV